MNFKDFFLELSSNIIEKFKKFLIKNVVFEIQPQMTDFQ